MLVWRRPGPASYVMCMSKNLPIGMVCGKFEKTAERIRQTAQVISIECVNARDVSAYAWWSVNRSLLRGGPPPERRKKFEPM